MSDSRRRNPARKNGQKHAKKSNPTITLTGAPPQAQQTWWSQRFIKVLESFKLGSRLARGKAYAQEGKVLKISITSGQVTSAVQGSRKTSYKVAIRLDPLSDHSWRQVFQNLTRRAIYSVEILMDRIPTDAEAVFASANVSLFPEKLEDLQSECDCPDWSNPCKHIAATYYVIAQHFDLDPFLIFAWRGRLKTQVLDALRMCWKQGKSRAFQSAMGQEAMTDEEWKTFWHGNQQATVTALNPFSKAVPDSNIQRLGEAPFQLAGRNLNNILAECYQITSNTIRDWSTTSQPGARSITHDDA